MSRVTVLWGPPAGGQLQLGAWISSYLADKDNASMLVDVNAMVPALPILFPGKRTEQSLGSLLAEVTISQDEILKNTVTMKKQENLGVLAYGLGENAQTYAEYTEQKVLDLIVQLRHTVDHIVIICDPDGAKGVFTEVAWKQADTIIQVCRAKLETVSYFSSQTPLLPPVSDRQRHLKFLWSERNAPVNEIKDALGGTVHVQPLTEEAVARFESGAAFDVPGKKAEARAFAAFMGEVKGE